MGADCSAQPRPLSRARSAPPSQSCPLSPALSAPPSQPRPLSPALSVVPRRNPGSESRPTVHTSIDAGNTTDTQHLTLVTDRARVPR